LGVIQNIKLAYVDHKGGEGGKGISKDADHLVEHKNEQKGKIMAI